MPLRFVYREILPHPGHGSSGKTQVYIRLLQEIVRRGKRGMILVPEIALTPQIMAKFSSYFGNKAAMLHSGLRMSERYDQWKRVRRGEVDVVLGTRTAVRYCRKRPAAPR